MAIKTLENQLHLEGTVLFLNAAIETYLARPTNKSRSDRPFTDLKAMMQQSLYISDHRCASLENNVQYNQIELIGFNESGINICFIIFTTPKLTVVDFKKASLTEMSDITQKMISDLKKKFLPESKAIVGVESFDNRLL